MSLPKSVQHRRWKSCNKVVSSDCLFFCKIVLEGVYRRDSSNGSKSCAIPQTEEHLLTSYPFLNPVKGSLSFVILVKIFCDPIIPPFQFRVDNEAFFFQNTREGNIRFRGKVQKLRFLSAGTWFPPLFRSHWCFSSVYNRSRYTYRVTKLEGKWQDFSWIVLAMNFTMMGDLELWLEDKQLF